MNIMNSLNSYKANWIDVVLVKISVFAATLLLAKLWGSVLDLNWYWYLIVWFLAAIIPIRNGLRWLKNITRW